MLGDGLSDIEEGNTRGFCGCGAQSYYWIEIETESGWRDRGLYCRAHGDEVLAQLRLDVEEDRRLDAIARARLGYDPAQFCEECGYRYQRGPHVGGCRCYADFLQPAAWEVEPYDPILYRDERREILAGWDRPRIPSLSR